MLLQIPGLTVAADQTEVLARGYWPSYNVPFYPENLQASSTFGWLGTPLSLPCWSKEVLVLLMLLMDSSHSAPATFFKLLRLLQEGGLQGIHAAAAAARRRLYGGGKAEVLSAGPARDNLQEGCRQRRGPGLPQAPHALQLLPHRPCGFCLPACAVTSLTQCKDDIHIACNWLLLSHARYIPREGCSGGCHLSQSSCQMLTNEASGHWQT